jgi:hypothetical protein
MSLIDAFRNYRALTSEQVALLGSKRIDGSRTPREWVAFLAGIAAYDSTADGLRKAAGWGIAIGAILSILIMAFELYIVALVFFLATILSAILFMRLRRDDLPNNMRHCVLPLVALLREEMEPDAQLELRVDLTGGLRSEKQVGQPKQLPPGKYIKGEEKLYRDGWFEGEGTFADGSSVSWSVIDVIRQREITKRSRSNKIKTKKKFKVRRMLVVRVGLRQESYALADRQVTGGRGHDRLAIKEGAKRNVMKLRRIVTEMHPNATLDPKHIFDLLAAAYRRVTLNEEV